MLTNQPQCTKCREKWGKEGLAAGSSGESSSYQVAGFFWFCSYPFTEFSKQLWLVCTHFTDEKIELSPGSINLKSESRQVCLIPKFMLFITGYSFFIYLGLSPTTSSGNTDAESSIRDLKKLPAAILSKPLLAVGLRNLWEKSQWITNSFSLLLLSLSLGRFGARCSSCCCVSSAPESDRGQRRPGRTAEKRAIRT